MATRRSFLGSAASLAAASAATACLKGEDAEIGTSGDSGSGEPVDPADDTPIDAVTANEEFYTVAISGFTPDQAWLDAWTLQLGDDDGNTLSLTLSELQALGGTDQERTLSCIGGSTGRTMSNAVWTGISMADLLAATGFAPDERLVWIRFTSGDGYATCIPRSDIDAGLAFAWAMNGAPLPANHGAPLRALVPNRFGMKNPKWIERIDFIEEFEAGFWESRGWSQDANYKVQSFFRSPDSGSILTAAGGYIKGCAFAGERGITKVEVSDNYGATWAEAEITYPGGPGVWTLWQLMYSPGEGSSVTLVVRATAADGTVQTDAEEYDADLDGFDGFDELFLSIA